MIVVVLTALLSNKYKIGLIRGCMGTRRWRGDRTTQRCHDLWESSELVPSARCSKAAIGSSCVTASPHSSQVLTRALQFRQYNTHRHTQYQYMEKAPASGFTS